jgi:hypothetical protein
MLVFFDIAAMQAKGTPPEDLKNLIQERYKTTAVQNRTGV